MVSHLLKIKEERKNENKKTRFLFYFDIGMCGDYIYFILFLIHFFSKVTHLPLKIKEEKIRFFYFLFEFVHLSIIFVLIPYLFNFI